MSGGFKGGASRASIPSGVRKTIENIKEITGQNHTEDEIYAMLKECSMDPNETTQKLLLLDTFHEVKRKRDKRKENLNKEAAESKWKPGPQGRENRVSRGNYPSRYTSQDAGVGRNMAAVKENTSSHHSEKGTSKGPLATSPDTRKYETSSASPTTGVSNGPSGTVSESTNVIHENHSSVGEDVNQSNTAAVVSIKKSNAPVKKGTKQHKMLELSNSESSFPSLPTTESYIPSSDTAPLPSQDIRVPGAVGTILRKSRTQRAPTEPLEDNLTESKLASAKKSASEIGVTNLEKKLPNDFQEVGKNQHLESTQAASSTGSRPSSNHSNRSQANGPQKVGPGKEWKPKSTNPNIGSSGTMAGSSKVSAASTGSNSELSQTTGVIASKGATLELQRKLEETQISDTQHVIIPNHLHVPVSGKLGFCFGSFDASFDLDMDQNVVPESEKGPQLSELSKPTDEPVKDLQLSNQNVLSAPEDTETKYHDHPKSPSEAPANFSASEIDVSSNVDPKPEVAPGNHQHHLVHISPNYSYGFMPPIMGGQLPSSESSESQPHDPSRLPAIVPQSFDPASYYAQFYRPSLDSDGRISPFHTPGASNKYNGNAAVVSSQTPQEVLSTASQTQQPLPIFRQPTGVHLPHYPPNYIPYGHYFPPFYVPQPAIHQFLTNGAYPQQPPTNAKYTISQYKQGPNTGVSTHVGIPGNYGPYGLYTSSSAMPAVTSTSNDDVSVPQTKENNVYATGQQNEGSGVWFATPGRDISTLQASSFYNVPQGQLGFPGHGPFAFHPGQAILQQSQPVPGNPVDNVGPTTGVYHQQQHTQHNWPSNY